MGMSVGGKGKVKSEINVTPLVDVVLVLLIIFMVVTPMLQKGRPVQLPTTANPSALPEDDSELLISVAFWAYFRFRPTRVVHSTGAPPGIQ